MGVTPTVCRTSQKPAEAVSISKMSTLAEINLRHRAWVGRRQISGDPLAAARGWRLVNRCRQSVVKWLTNVDANIMSATSWSGLSTLRYDPESPLWLHLIGAISRIFPCAQIWEGTAALRFSQACIYSCWIGTYGGAIATAHAETLTLLIATLASTLSPS